MISRVCLCAVMLLASIAGAQTITGVSGQIDHDESIVIGGSGFGTKTTAAPVVYDDFNDGSHGADVDLPATVGAWSLVEASVSGWNPVYDTSNARTGASLVSRHRQSIGLYKSAIQINSSKFNSGIYIDAWVDFDYESAAPWCRKHQPFYLRSTTAPSPEIHFSYQYSDYTYPCSVSDWKITSYVEGGSSPQYTYATKDEMRSGWHHIQMYFEANDIGSANGKAYAWLNHNLKFSDDSVTWRAGSDGLWERFMLGYYYAYDSIGGCPTPQGDWDNNWDNIYIDYTRARVELGNAAFYDDCTHREIQIPSEWSASSITATINTGTFATDDSAWLFVVDESGNVSSGYPVIIGQSGGGITPVDLTAPTNLEVTEQP